MSHLLAALIEHEHPMTLLLVGVIDVLGSALAVVLLLRRRAKPHDAVLAVAGFASVLTACSWFGFRLAVASAYPIRHFDPGFRSTALALAFSFLGAATAGAVQIRYRRCARNALAAGSILACGSSCMLFTGMAGVVAPFALAYDLEAVLITMVFGSALCGFAFWEVENSCRRKARPLAVGLIALAMTWLSIGSLGAILPFGAWMVAVAHPDDLASSPVAIIVAAEAAVVLVLSLSGTLVDNRVAVRDRLEADRLRQVADSSFEAILIHRDGCVLDANRSASTMLGLEPSALRGERLARFLGNERDEAVLAVSREQRPGELEIVTAERKTIPVEVLSRTIVFCGRPAVVTALRDVRERRASQARIEFLAHHDVLTELPNRALLTETLQSLLDAATRSAAEVAVLCLDLDGFKAVNDTLGHAAGDQLLREVASRLRENVRAADLVGRVGGDEFILLQTASGGPDAIGAFASRVIEHLTRPFEIEDVPVTVGCSVGIAVCPAHGTTVADLLRHADIALYRAKEGGRGMYCVFDPAMADDLRERRELEHELRIAVTEGLLTLNFQPLFNSRCEPIAAEALARWVHPRLGMISPAQFIPLAEECGLIEALGAWVLRAACLEAVSWNNECRVAVNLSPAQFRKDAMPGLVRGVLAETGLPAHRLELEITEGLLINDADDALRTLEALRSLGVRIVLDDFGTGYSSLSYLHRFPFDKIKVDRSFVQRLDDDADARAIVGAIIAMSRNLKLGVTAEGVETLEQFELLTAQGCDELQGFLLARPLAQHMVGRFLAECADASMPREDDDGGAETAEPLSGPAGVELALS